MSTPPGSANISTREYIYHLPYPLPQGTPVPYTTGLPLRNPLDLASVPTEPTSTLVLTSPLSTFVDIRILKPLQPTDPALPNSSSPNPPISHRLEWGFAGFSTSEPLPAQSADEPHEYEDDEDDDGNEGSVTQSTWHHWLDSKFPLESTDIPLDSGTMYPLSPELTLEHGSSFDPSTQQMACYEEMWRDVPILPCFPEKGRFCIVARLHVPASSTTPGVRGLVIRLGQFCQGIMQTGEDAEKDVAVERWEFVPKTETRVGEGGGGEQREGEEYVEGEGETVVVGGEWERSVKIGEVLVPCAVLCQKEREVKLGGRIVVGMYEWVVEEYVEWGP